MHSTRTLTTNKQIIRSTRKRTRNNLRMNKHTINIKPNQRLIHTHRNKLPPIQRQNRINTTSIILTTTITITTTKLTIINPQPIIKQSIHITLHQNLQKTTNTSRIHPSRNTTLTTNRQQTTTMRHINIIINTIQLITTINHTNSIHRPRTTNIRCTIIVVIRGIIMNPTSLIKMLNHQKTIRPNTNNILLTTNSTITIIHIQNRISR